MRRVFISDLHLESESDPAFLRFCECLTVEAPRNHEVFILGDLVEMWIGDDDDSDIAQALQTQLRTCAATCDVFVLHGNRDFLFADDFAANTGVQLIPDPYLTNDGVLLSHGDRYCTDDTDYQSMRALFRSASWQQDILSKSLDERKALGAMLRAQSKESNANKATNIMDVNGAEVHKELHTHGSRRLVHGHTHRPGLHTSDDQQRWVLGAWENVGWVLRQKDTQMQLEAFSLARRYGT